MSGRSPEDEPSTQPPVSTDSTQPPSSTASTQPSSSADSTQPSSSADSTPLAQSIPSPPEGYADPYTVRYPRTALYLLPVPLVLGSVVLFGWLTWLAHGREILTAVSQTTVVEGDRIVTMDLISVGIPLVLALAVTAVFHELCHGLALRYYGHEVEYGASLTAGAFYTAALDQFVTRDQLLVVALAPLAGISLVCVPLLAVPVPLVAVTAFFVLVLNTGGAGGDLYLAWRSLQMPPGTLVYDADMHHSYVYEPLVD